MRGHRLSTRRKLPGIRGRGGLRARWRRSGDSARCDTGGRLSPPLVQPRYFCAPQEGQRPATPAPRMCGGPAGSGRAPTAGPPKSVPEAAYGYGHPSSCCGSTAERTAEPHEEQRPATPTPPLSMFSNAILPA